MTPILRPWRSSRDAVIGGSCADIRQFHHYVVKCARPMSALGEFEQLVLFAVLRLDQDASGVAIHDEIEARTGRDVSPGAIYTTLGRLEERGLVRSIVIGAGIGASRTSSQALRAAARRRQGAARRLRQHPGARRGPAAKAQRSGERAMMRVLRWLTALVVRGPDAPSSGTTSRRCTRGIARAACRRRAPAGATRGCSWPPSASLLNATRINMRNAFLLGSAPGGASARARSRLHGRLGGHAWRQPGALRDRGGAGQCVPGARSPVSGEPPAVRRSVRSADRAVSGRYGQARLARARRCA